VIDGNPNGGFFRNRSRKKKLNRHEAKIIELDEWCDVPRTYHLMEKGLKTRIGKATHLFKKLDALQGHQHKMNSINFDEAVRYRYAET
jgi:hypothetical protein